MFYYGPTGKPYKFSGLSFLSVSWSLKYPPVLTFKALKAWSSSTDPLTPNRDSMPGLQPDQCGVQQGWALTRWKASWECWKVRSMYLRTDKADPRTMGYRSLEKTWKRIPGQEPSRPGPPKAECSHRLELKQQTHVRARIWRSSQTWWMDRWQNGQQDS